ncbi:hypothetical protein Rsub_08722 [Raphidocelis subcapitata]|uniref:Cupin type-2 domain-containing protein n=1 Tax=Raphidocelis subcapitata TaxID=307507 RepID=A0A2V0PCX7_9CHLO|nr:hypothetical protein Rsub_08722 [Raphidocelis subcapitata]|eukprot:GBF95740.1 hypothetical protein Rsub_08722 [Raphidocelis subcapitata]
MPPTRYAATRRRCDALAAAAAVALAALLFARPSAAPGSSSHRRDQSGLVWLEGGGQDAWRVLSRGRECCAFEQRIRGGGGPPLHRHPASVETFEVLHGMMAWKVEGAQGQAAAGQRLVVPAGAAHSFRNAGAPDEELYVRFTVQPCGAAVSFFENLAGVSADAGGRGRVPLLQRLLLYSAHGVELAGLPRPLWRVAVALAAPLARAAGFAASYPAYGSAGGKEEGGGGPARGDGVLHCAANAQ